MPAIANAARIEVSADAAAGCAEYPTLRFFLDIWQRKRGTKAMPARADFKPAEIKAHIGSMVVAEAVGDFDDFRFKLIGTDVARYFLSDCTGKTVKESYPPPNERFGECVLKNYRDAALSRAPLYTRLDAIRWSNNFVYDMRAVYLPLSENGHTATSVLAAFVYNFSSIPSS